MKYVPYIGLALVALGSAGLAALEYWVLNL